VFLTPEFAVVFVLMLLLGLLGLLSRYRAHIMTNYFEKLTEQRHIKRCRDEALKRIKQLSQKEYQTVNKTHERLLKEARLKRSNESSALHHSSDGKTMAHPGRSDSISIGGVKRDFGKAMIAALRGHTLSGATSGTSNKKRQSTSALGLGGQELDLLKRSTNETEDFKATPRPTHNHHHRHHQHREGHEAKEYHKQENSGLKRSGGREDGDPDEYAFSGTDEEEDSPGGSLRRQDETEAKLV